MNAGFRWFVLLLLVLATAGARAAPPQQAGAGTSLRFFGNGVNDIDRVKIRIDGPEVPADIGATDFTIEFWMMANPGENNSGACIASGDNWIRGNIIIDRDIFGGGDYGDYGISLYGGVIAFGVHNGSSGTTLCGSTPVANSQWHHIAVVRVRNTGLMQIYVDGSLNATTTGPTGDISYRNGRTTSWPNDPFIVIGAEKHDVSSLYPSFRGWLDELRLSNIRRYTGSFTPPTAPFETDANTVGLYHFDEGSGTAVNDSSGGGSHGVVRFGGSPAGPVWAGETPFGGFLSAPAPIAPAVSTDLLDTRPLFTWSLVPGASGYELELSGSTGVLPPFTTLFETGDTHFRPEMPLLPGSYTWRVRAVNGSSESAWSSPTHDFRIISANNAAPGRNFTTDNTPALAWNRVSWAVGYQIQVATDLGFTQIVLDQTVNARTLTTALPPQPNGVYFWRVRALRLGASGAWSAVEPLSIYAP